MHAKTTIAGLEIENRDCSGNHRKEFERATEEKKRCTTCFANKTSDINEKWIPYPPDVNDKLRADSAEAV